MLGAASLAFCWNAVTQRGARVFWSLLGLGSFLWTVNMGIWSYYEVILRRELPEPCIGDVILFIHVIPVMAAVALLPHRPKGDRKASLNAINFLIVLIWWFFLSSFISLPHPSLTL